MRTIVWKISSKVLYSGAMPRRMLFGGRKSGMITGEPSMGSIMARFIRYPSGCWMEMWEPRSLELMGEAIVNPIGVSRFSTNSIK